MLSAVLDGLNCTWSFVFSFVEMKKIRLHSSCNSIANKNTFITYLPTKPPLHNGNNKVLLFPNPVCSKPRSQSWWSGKGVIKNHQAPQVNLALLKRISHMAKSLKILLIYFVSYKKLIYQKFWISRP